MMGRKHCVRACGSLMPGTKVGAFSAAIAITVTAVNPAILDQAR